MTALLRPVQAGARDLAGLDGNVQLGEQRDAFRGDDVSGELGLLDEGASGAESLREGDTEPSGEMVVAPPGRAKGMRARSFP